MNQAQRGPFRRIHHPAHLTHSEHDTARTANRSLKTPYRAHPVRCASWRHMGHGELGSGGALAQNA